MLFTAPLKNSCIHLVTGKVDQKKSYTISAPVTPLHHFFTSYRVHHLLHHLIHFAANVTISQHTILCLYLFIYSLLALSTHRKHGTVFLDTSPTNISHHHTAPHHTALPPLTYPIITTIIIPRHPVSPPFITTSRLTTSSPNTTHDTPTCSHLPIPSLTDPTPHFLLHCFLLASAPRQMLRGLCYLHPRKS